ncbi:hypothetical protein FOQG_08670 [Fusarium oxysporum f. sp. raphani 54005]|uniref:Uncharacterized protein n=9 Tax=Fusarium oxysporum species complex TaxID=171631 RepID=X0C983_FUSOX|nr:uncharacterized protein FOIG_06136 [Fusarium odoratissimum NRRL 54006]EWZ42790.1 hypothetical protein FOZG_07605 [Fusarium oxysporum Fo47]EXA00123.1 hypothetical protein FOWG_00447 [Fusarium oxysporum f. sp. lycopersici MN25]EXA46931.1 hypothetical protein FOVG_04218 [Fusarium oxysporum f. sp. pisi HDV247]EXK33097.1 hypothetical protein FOMG_11879 [Fusarium oxysporum f. sp. melonis 26406]EXK87768.1 hypothetical protein FOQG_08670 [Fusarium oxysporum f. sp. raphani 54005]EXL58799.1 hypothet
MRPRISTGPQSAESSTQSKARNTALPTVREQDEEEEEEGQESNGGPSGSSGSRPSVEQRPHNDGRRNTT